MKMLRKVTIIIGDELAYMKYTDCTNDNDLHMVDETSLWSWFQTPQVIDVEKSNVFFEEKDVRVGGRVRVMTGENRVMWGRWTEITLRIYLVETV